MSAPEPTTSRSLDAWLEHLEAAHVRAIDLGLERVRRVWEALGAPRPGMHVVTVAGTNGKGSVVHTLDALARANGLRTATTTSPHLQRFNERIRIDGREAEDDVIVAAFERIEAARTALAGGPVTLTYFEAAILAALLVMADAQPELAVLEVGLGGRLDAVNIVDADVAVLTPVDLDHQAWLGDDRETIGAEKAGILRAGRPVVITDPEPPASVLGHARELAAPTLALGRDFAFEAGVYRGAATRVTPAALELSGLEAPGVHPSAVAGALTVLRALGVDLDARRSRHALATLVVAGRLQRVDHDGTPFVLDVAHNPHAARTLAARLPGTERYELVFGAFVDKDVEGILAALAARLSGVTLVATPGGRGASAEALANRLVPCELPDVAPVDSLEAGLARARERACGGPVLVCGSFTVVGAALEQLGSAA